MRRTLCLILACLSMFAQLRAGECDQMRVDLASAQSGAAPSHEHSAPAPGKDGGDDAGEVCFTMTRCISSAMAGDGAPVVQAQAGLSIAVLTVPDLYHPPVLPTLSPPPQTVFGV